MSTSTKIENKLQEIYDVAGYDWSVDNRSYFTKSINNALTMPNVSLKICKKGYVWTSKSGYKYNVVIRIDGKGKMFKHSSPDAEALCELFASVTQMDHVKQSFHVHQDAYECDKCHGEGIIPFFMHVCKGVCFSCLGRGFRFHSENLK